VLGKYAQSIEELEISESAIDGNDLTTLRSMDKLTHLTMNKYTNISQAASPKEGSLVVEELNQLPAETFADMTKLVSVALPNRVIEMKDNIFKGCSALESVQLPAKIETIGEGTFSGCAALQSIYFAGNIPPFIADASSFEGKTIYVPEGRMEAYLDAYSWINVDDLQEYFPVIEPERE